MNIFSNNHITTEMTMNYLYFKHFKGIRIVVDNDIINENSIQVQSNEEVCKWSGYPTYL